MERSKKLKRILKIIVIAVLAVIVVLIAGSFVKFPFNMHPTARGVLNSEITSITLGPTYDPYLSVTFSDPDLIKKWSDYLGTLKIQYRIELYPACEVCFPRDGGGGNGIEITTADNKTLYLVSQSTLSGKHVLGFGSSLQRYNVISDNEFPFKETYEAAKERYGLVKN